MRLYRPMIAAAFCAAALACSGASDAQTRDYGQITCQNFLASGQLNMGYILWWLHGYHSGKTGVPMFDPKDAYAARLGYYCRNHPHARLIDASEQILSSLDRGL